MRAPDMTASAVARSSRIVALVAAAAEGDEMTAGGSELAVGRDGGVEEDEGQGASAGAFHGGQHAGKRVARGNNAVARLGKAG